MPSEEGETDGSLLGDDNSPLRHSVDDARASVEDDEGAGLLHQDGFELSTGRGGDRKTVTAYGGRNPASASWLPRLRRPSRSCLLVLVILSIGLLGVLASSGYVFYAVRPVDGQSPPWYPSPRGGTDPAWAEAYEKAAALVRRMSLPEKVNITTGTGWSQDLCVGNTAPAVHVGFPALCLQDGPLGIRFVDHATAWPAGITVGATWDRELMYERGRAHGMEARLKGVNVILGPSMGPLGRMPAGGRNWEGFGSDPVLQGVAAAETIRGIQDEGVMATAKHLIGNEQEHFRQSFEWGLPNSMSSNIDDRTLHELYLWPFAESVRAGVASVMCSYNMVNNSYACGNSKLLNGILKDELGFQGFVQADWLAQRSGVASALAGLDMSMPGDGLHWADGDSLFGPHLTLAVLNGSLPMERLDDMVLRIVAAWYKLGQDDRAKWPAPPPDGDGGPNFSSWTDEGFGKVHEGSDDGTTARVNGFVDVQGFGKEFHGRLAQKIAAEGTIVLKNDGDTLPLSRTGPSSGPRPADGTRFKVGIFGEDAGPGRGANACPDRGCNQGTLASGWGSGAVEFPYLVTPLQALESAFDFKAVDLTSSLTDDVDRAKTASLARDRDLCLVFVNSDSGEGFRSWGGHRGDRNDLFLQKDGDRLVRTVADSCGNGTGATVVVIHSVGPVILERWIDLPGVRAVVLANLPGQESGNALADVLFGDVDASGRLPYTIGRSLADYGPGGQVLYYPNGVIPQQDFAEGLYIDYRHFDRHGIAPRYEFGYGLSYTTFSYTDLVLTTVRPKSALPSPRPAAAAPPSLDSRPPDPKDALFPTPFRRLRKRIYPYIASLPVARQGPHPPSHDVPSPPPSPPSAAGGAQGGNPSLHETHLRVGLTLANTGPRRGKDVVQLYLSFPARVTDPATGAPLDFPPRVLRAFRKVQLESGASARVELVLSRKDLSYWCVVRQNWVMPDGPFTVSVGRSSRDLRLQGTW